jgi:hypothetical protein
MTIVSNFCKGQASSSYKFHFHVHVLDDGQIQAETCCRNINSVQHSYWLCCF